jgi:2-dehydro-3-deoxyphosphogluconate aldolase/(4S)-4-hydroxy-2-oxoglutarate aldolase
VGVGSNLTGGAQRGDFQSITDLAKQFIAKIRQARGN